MAAQRGHSVLKSLLRRGRNGDRAVEAADDAPPRSAGRPTIGLALGGGAARGFAYIGVLRTLLAHGIKPDAIAGTSIGAVIGGCYAAGVLEPFAEWATRLTRRRVLSYLDFSLTGAGLINGGRLARRLEAAMGDAKIETLQTRFAAIATEIENGHEVWLTRGRLVEALRASYALPGIFTPVHISGRWLVDGALVNPVPVSAARALNARLVIGVNTNADFLGRGTIIQDHGVDDQPTTSPPKATKPGWRNRISAESLLRRQFVGGHGRPGIPTVMVEAFTVMQDRITRARLAGDPADIMISPRIGHIGMFDFHRAEEAIRIGAEATERTIDAINEAVNALA